MLDIILKTLDKAVLYDINVYNMERITPFYDYSVICSASTSRQGVAAVNYLKDEAQKNNLCLKGYTKNNDSKWFLIDLGAVVVHVFVGEERKKYNLDEMYSQR